MKSCVLFLCCVIIALGGCKKCITCYSDIKYADGRGVPSGPYVLYYIDTHKLNTPVTFDTAYILSSTAHEVCSSYSSTKVGNFTHVAAGNQLCD